LYHIVEVALCEFSWPPRTGSVNVPEKCAYVPGTRKGCHYISRAELPKM